MTESPISHSSTSIQAEQDTIILGVSAYYHDSAAAIIVNGNIVAASQQERYSRIKHDASFPKDAINFCLQQANVTIEQVSAFVFYDKPLLKFERLLETYLANAPKGYLSFVRAMPIWLKEKLYLKKVLRDELAKLEYERYAQEQLCTYSEAKRQLKKSLKLPQLLFTEHHQAHAGAAYYPSPYTNTAVLCLDGVGEWATSSIWRGNLGKLHPIMEIQFPHSLGLLYSAFTQYCGFKVNSGEYKLMGLAPYGEAKYVDTIYQHLINLRSDGSFSLDMQYFDFATGRTMTNAKFHALFAGEPHPFDAQMTQKQMDLAKSIQVVTEEIVLKIVNKAYELCDSENLCLAGGAALNCVANGRILRESKFKNVWIQPAAGDAGSALGAALVVWHEYFINDKSIKTDDAQGYIKDDAKQDTKQDTKQEDFMRGAYLGDAYTHEQARSVCQQQNVPFHELDDTHLYSTVAQAIANGKVVGWFQDAMEFGPRALGNRSILGDPRSQQMQSQMNIKIKQRESFRPFAPAVLEHDITQWFNLDSISPYMLITAAVNEQKRIDVSPEKGLSQLRQVRSLIPAVTHVDYSARVQSVSEHSNPKFYRLISEFKNISGVGVLINTSFNVRGEPPVRTVEDAIRGFLATEMDILVVQNCLLYKTEQQSDAIQHAKQVTFEKD